MNAYISSKEKYSSGIRSTQESVSISQPRLSKFFVINALVRLYWASTNSAAMDFEFFHNLNLAAIGDVPHKNLTPHPSDPSRILGKRLSLLDDRRNEEEVRHIVKLFDLYG